MIRRDYILRMLEEFFEVLARIRALQKGEKWQEASLAADKEFLQLVGARPQAIVHLSETELLARLIKGEPSQAVREKTLMLATLLKEAGDISYGQTRDVEGRSFYLKGLQLLLGVLEREQVVDFPEFVPRVDAFLQVLSDAPLPITTQGMLMQHFERIGEFAKAEDVLFSMIEAQPGNLALLSFGVAFYQRMLGKSDDVLQAGNLPRVELESGLAHILALQEKETSRQVAGSE
jgi:hypothetical protein